MTNRKERDAERRKYIKEKTMANLNTVLDDPESLFASELEENK